MEIRCAVHGPLPPRPVVSGTPLEPTAAPPRAGVESEPSEAQAVTPGRTPERGEVHRLPARVFAVGSMA
jgi:hypothetical protein